MGLRVSEFSSAGVLDGTETVGLVRGDENVGTTTGAIAALSLGGDSVATSRGVLAALTAVDGTARLLSEGDRSGLFQFDASDLSAEVTADIEQGIYIAPASDATGATGAWVRKFTGPVDPQWFGLQDSLAVPGNGAANSAAVAAMLAALRARAVNIFTNYQGIEPVRFPGGYFELSSTIDLTDGTFIIEGVDTGGPSGRGTRLKFPAGVTGIRVQRFNTSGASTVDGVTHRGSDGSMIRGLSLTGAYGGVEAEAHGIHARAKVFIEDVDIELFEGDGIFLDGIGSNNVNYSRVIGGNVIANRTGLKVDGADGNICTIINLSVGSNRQWGVWDSSFLGNTYLGIHADANGISASAAALAPTVVSHAGNRYGVIVGQEVGASTNAPSGTTADNTWWYYNGAGGVGTGIPAWLSGTTYRAGGGYHVDDNTAKNAFVGCYFEGGQGKSQIISPTMISGGNVADGVRDNGVAKPLMVSGQGITFMGTARFGRLYAQYPGTTDPLFTIHRSDALGASKQVKVEWAQGYEADGVTPCSLAVLSAMSTGADPATNWAQLLLSLRQAGTVGIKYRFDASTFFPETDNAILLGQSTLRWSTIYGYTGDFTTQVKIANVKVVGGQGAAVADAAALTSVNASPSVAAPTKAEFDAFVAEFNKLRTDLGATRTQLNLALARLRTHGLIAT